PVALAAAAAAVIALGLLATHTTAVPYNSVVVPVLVAGLFLRTKSLLVVDLATVGVIIRAAVTNGIHVNDPGSLRVGTLLVIAITTAFAPVIAASREGLGLQRLRGDAMLAELRDRLTSQGRFPDLPAHWHAELARRAAGGSAFGGDFIVAALSDNDK